jgi:hypothetical protein
MDNNKTEQEHRETNLKAKMAQSLVRDLLTEAGNDIYKTGYEDMLPATLALQDALERNKRLSDKLKAIPDFLIVDTKGQPHLAHVKFRWNPEGHKNDIKKLAKISEHWEEAIIIFVNCLEKPYFRVSHAPFVNKRGQLITSPLESFENFAIPHALVSRFEILVAKYLTPTLFPKQ